MLNESSISGTPLAIGYRATIYLGRWALGYTSNETVANWEYRKSTQTALTTGAGKHLQNSRIPRNRRANQRRLNSESSKGGRCQNMMMLKAMEKQSCRSPLKQWSAPVQTRSDL
ncbi:YfkD family protein [Bacillus licheniformis]|nr:YfkD family protein [Bacillus licheniformis]